MKRLICRRYRGTGTIPDIAYDICWTMQYHKAKRYFNFGSDDIPSEVNNRSDGYAIQEIYHDLLAM